MDLHIDKSELFKAQMEEQKEQRVFYLSAAVCTVFCGFRWYWSCPSGCSGNLGSCKAFVAILEPELIRPGVIGVRSARGWLCWPCPSSDGEAEPLLALHTRADPTALIASAGDLHC